MPRKTTQPVTDAGFIAWAGTVFAHCVKHATEWGLPTATLTDIGSKRADAEAAYAANQDIAGKSRATVAAKNETFRILREAMRLFTPTLVVNMKISNDELEQMGLPTRIHHYHGPLPVPSHTPNVDVHSGEHHVVDVYVSNPQLGQSTTYLKDHEEYGFILRHKLDDEDVWHEKNYTRLHVRLTFEDKDVRKNLSLQVAWINPRLEHGPWSDMITVIIN